MLQDQYLNSVYFSDRETQYNIWNSKNTHKKKYIDTFFVIVVEYIQDTNNCIIILIIKKQLNSKIIYYNYI